MASQILLGVVLGIAGAAPFSVALARSVARGPKGPGVRSGLVCIVVSALIVLVGMALAHRLWAESRRCSPCSRRSRRWCSWRGTGFPSHLTGWLRRFRGRNKNFGKRAHAR